MKWSLVVLFILLQGCGDGPAAVDSELKPNFVGNGFSANVRQTSANTFLFTITENSRYRGAVFSVYGLNDESQIMNMNLAARVRLSHVYDGHSVGQSFEVTFNNDDNWFVIFEDEFFSGTYVYDKDIELLRGQLRD